MELYQSVRKILPKLKAVGFPGHPVSLGTVKGSVYLFLRIGELFKLHFLVYLEATWISCYAFHETSIFSMFKIDKTHIKRFL